MKVNARVGGAGGIAFGVLSLVALFTASPLGGNYSASDAASYVSSGHRAAVFVSLYLAMFGVIGLACLVTCLRESVTLAGDSHPPAAAIFWSVGLIACAAFAAGWAIIYSLPMAYAYSTGNGFGVGPAEAYAISQIGGVVVYGAAAVLLGAALLALGIAGREVLPNWLRWLTLIVGVLGLASPAWFPWFALPLWAVVTGIWLLAPGRTASLPASAEQQPRASTPVT